MKAHVDFARTASSFVGETLCAWDVCRTSAPLPWLQPPCYSEFEIVLYIRNDVTCYCMRVHCLHSDKVLDIEREIYNSSSLKAWPSGQVRSRYPCFEILGYEPQQKIYCPFIN